MDAVLRRDQAGQKRRPRGRADGIAAQSPREPHALGGQTIDVRRADVGVAVAAERPRPLIVRQNEDDIRLRDRLGSRKGWPRKGQQGEKEGQSWQLHSGTPAVA